MRMQLPLRLSEEGGILDACGKLACDIDVHALPRRVVRGRANQIIRACNAHDALVAALSGLFEHCLMIHRYWGENSNTKEARAAVKAARAALEEATS